MFRISSFLYVFLLRLSKHWMFLWKFSPSLLQRLEKPKCSLAIEFSLIQTWVFSCNIIFSCNKQEGFLNFIAKLRVCNQTLCIYLPTSKSMDAWSLKLSECISFPLLCPLMCGSWQHFICIHLPTNISLLLGVCETFYM
jgi:hypothetical protein